jgi:glycosyltransferase involved in cell wall biosynthesis
MTPDATHTVDDTRPAAAPRVSVISTFLNAERFITEAIESVLAQDFQDFELILIDDGSTPESTEIARAYAARCAPVIRYFDHEGHRNRGTAASRNFGIAMARGELVAFIDADDVWASTKLAEQIAIMDARPELGMVCGAARYWQSWNGGTDVIVPTGHVANVVVPPPEAALALYPLGKAASPCPSDVLLRRKLVDTVGGFEERFTGAHQLYEDQVFLTKVYLAAPVYFSDRVWINYRQHAESCMARFARDDYYDEVRLYFLNWLERYLTTVPHPRPAVVRAALDRSLWRFRHPVLYAAAHRSSAILHTAQRLAGRLKRAVTMMMNA